MFHVWTIFFFCGFCFPVECLIPDLRVQKLDRKLIERKRQDTLDMCRMFTAETERLGLLKNEGRVSSRNIIETHTRVRRDVTQTNNSLDVADAKRVESIVDKLYDDMAEHGERVTYRQRVLSTAKVPITVYNKTARRFNFAPGMISAASRTPDIMVEDVGDYEIPWHKNWRHGIVPYFIDPNTYDTHLADVVIRAFDYFEKATCIRLQRLRERPTDKESLQNVEWLYITNPSGIRQCVHSNERKPNRGVQMVVLGYDCMSLGEVLHEVMHVLGFSHEHTRPDRDQYITVLWDNIKPGYKKYFDIRTIDPLSSLPYDYSSVLHYPPRAFSKNGQVTLLVEPGVKIGQREGLSDTDIAKVSMIFSAECMKRNKEYLFNTCPSVVKPRPEMTEDVTQNEIEDYFKDRLWPYAIINYKIRDKMEFSIEERENLDAVIRHIEKETCIEFRDISVYDNNENEYVQNSEKYDIPLDKDQRKDDFNQPDDNIVNETEIPELSQDGNTNTSRIKKAQYSIKGNSESVESGSTNSIDTEENVIDLRKNPVSDSIIAVSKKNAKRSSTPKSSRSIGKLPKGSSPQINGILQAKAASRRHAESTLALVRSPEPGCPCPVPGKPKGDQVLKINSGCFNSVNDLLHLFVHVLGLDHQHNMHDRDSYLRILWNNLTPEIRREMQDKLPPAAAVGFPYDYQSVMHYPWLQIKNGVTNIMYPTWNDGWAMGHWQGLSSTDVNKLNLIYYEQCSLRKRNTQNKVFM